MGQVLQWGLLQVGQAGLWRQRQVSTISSQRFGGFVESDSGRFDEVLGGWN